MYQKSRSTDLASSNYCLILNTVASFCPKRSVFLLSAVHQLVTTVVLQTFCMQTDVLPLCCLLCDVPSGLLPPRLVDYISLWNKQVGHIFQRV